MTSSVSDTDPQVRKVQDELFRKAPAWRKIQVLDEWNASLRLLIVAELRKRYPAAKEAEITMGTTDLLDRAIKETGVG